MKRLILMRHAKSDWSAGARGDHDRPLNDRGRRGAAALGDWLRGEGLTPDAVLCSSATRTRETLAGLGLPDGVPVDFTRDLYLATHDDMLQVLRGATGDCVLVLGHNPGISIAACELPADLPDHPRFEAFPTGATLVVDFDIDDWRDADWGTGRARQFTVPRDL